MEGIKGWNAVTIFSLVFVLMLKGKYTRANIYKVYDID